MNSRRNFKSHSGQEVSFKVPFRNKLLYIIFPLVFGTAGVSLLSITCHQLFDQSTSGNYSIFIFLSLLIATGISFYYFFSLLLILFRLQLVIGSEGVIFNKLSKKVFKWNEISSVVLVYHYYYSEPKSKATLSELILIDDNKVETPITVRYFSKRQKNTIIKKFREYRASYSNFNLKREYRRCSRFYTPF